MNDAPVKSKTLINDDFSFTSLKSLSISSTKQCLDIFRTNRKTILDNAAVPIFLDTNVLLLPYKVSIESRLSLLDYFTRNKSRIRISAHVEKEYLKNRCNVLETTTTSIGNLPTEFEKTVTNKITAFLSEKKKLIGEQTATFKAISDAVSNLSLLRKNLDDHCTSMRDEYSQWFYEDPALDILSYIQTALPLSPEEIVYINKLFQSLEKTAVTFPGKNDRSKPDNKEGDLIIFHELLKYSKENSTDLIFLTADTKEDWFHEVNGKKHPLIDYILRFYTNTQHHLYVFNFENATKLNLRTMLSTLATKHPQIPQQQPVSPYWLTSEVESDFYDNHLEEFDFPATDIEIYSAEIEDYNVESIMEHSESEVLVFGSGTASLQVKDEGEYSVIHETSFNFSGYCTIDFRQHKILKSSFDIDIDKPFHTPDDE